jgi:hypothetical protein
MEHSVRVHGIETFHYGTEGSCDKCNPAGTEWTEPGQGDSVGKLQAELFEDSTLPLTDKAFQNLAVLVRTKIGAFDWQRRTNLRLTGSPLTAQDLENIARAK